MGESSSRSSGGTAPVSISCASLGVAGIAGRHTVERMLVVGDHENGAAWSSPKFPAVVGAAEHDRRISRGGPLGCGDARLGLKPVAVPAEMQGAELLAGLSD